jgi:hypothetical protein
MGQSQALNSLRRLASFLFCTHNERIVLPAMTIKWARIKKPANSGKNQNGAI